jgi:hypothetical protein
MCMEKSTCQRDHTLLFGMAASENGTWIAMYTFQRLCLLLDNHLESFSAPGSHPDLTRRRARKVQRPEWRLVGSGSSSRCPESGLRGTRNQMFITLQSTCFLACEVLWLGQAVFLLLPSSTILQTFLNGIGLLVVRTNQAW